MDLEGKGAPDEHGTAGMPCAAGAVSGPGAPGVPGRPGPGRAGQAGAGGPGGSTVGEPGEPQARLPVLPGFREMALRRMAADRGRLVRELAARRQAAGLSQTEVAARMGTSQSAVARLESGEADARASTLERYAAAIGSQITWTLQG
ncbi:MAG TPA: helix-turn-helix transcriptional regulator [Streptosporangiaceae bacterium]|nr:helix-turn-helix transcriptional regulator [Streptosporangiaceae bacterium]